MLLLDEEPPPPPRPPPPVAPKLRQKSNASIDDPDTYELMNSCGPAPNIPSKKKVPVSMTEEERVILGIVIMCI